jgi:hypothetical protein
MCCQDDEPTGSRGDSEGATSARVTETRIKVTPADGATGDLSDGADAPADPIVERLDRVLEACGRVVIVATPIDAPRVASNAWCLLEAVRAFNVIDHNNNVIDVAVPERELDELRKRIECDDVSAMAFAKIAVDSRRAASEMDSSVGEVVQREFEREEGGYATVDKL